MSDDRELSFPAADRFAELLVRYSENSLDPQEMEELGRQLAADETKRRLFVGLCLQSHLLSGCLASGRGDEETPVLPRRLAPLGRRLAWTLAAVAASLLVVITLLMLRRSTTTEPLPDASLAKLTDGLGLSWESPTESHAVGQALRPGRYRLALGTAEITFRSGAVAVLEAPSELEILGSDRAILHHGQIVIRAEGRAKGFVLETARVGIVDLGTEFGVTVKRAGDTEVHVFEGTVTTESSTPRESPAPQQHLSAGQAIQYFEAAGRPPHRSTAAPQRFVRRFPAPQDGFRRTALSHRSRLDTIHIAAAPRRVVIDGELSEWNDAASFRAACEPPYGDTYFVQGRMMYDRDFLYIAAEVGDPFPMRNILDPKTDAVWAWRGGAVQVRLSTDRAQRWPLRAEAPSRLGRAGPVSPNDLSDRLAHLILWYFAPGDQPCLHLAYGMDLHGDVVNPPGYRGAFRRHPDNCGYVAEYAIAWSLLGAAADPPQAGDVLAATWNVNWSDESGRVWQGHLVDISNSRESGWTFQRAATWGRAIYDPSSRQ